MDKIKVLIVDDSAIVRDILSKSLSRNPKISVVGTAQDPYVARDFIEKSDVDVITLDIEMPKMDGLTFLKYLMKYNPIPVIILSSLTQGENKAAIEALEYGAIDIVNKSGGPYSVEEVADSLAAKIISASLIPDKTLQEISERVKETVKQYSLIDKSKKSILSNIKTTHQLIAVGASTGGTIALEVLFKSFTPSFPSTLAVIHMPEHFTASFAQRLDSLCQVHVKEAEDGELIMPATVYIAPGNFHMLVELSGANRIIRVKDGPKVHSQRPAVDILFNSVAEKIGTNSIGVLLTGMGRDGAEGLKAIKDSGGYTIAQDEKSCIVFGMPKEAIELGGASEVTSLQNIADSIQKQIR